MQQVTLGKTGIVSPKNAFGALPIQRVEKAAAVTLLQAAVAGGFRFFDTARSYSDSEYKLGLAFANNRKELVLATKTPSITVAGFWQDLKQSLLLLQTDYVDIYQFHNPAFCPKPGDGTGLYEAMLEAREKGMIRFIGITNHRLQVAREAVESGLYDTLQFPFSYLADQQEQALVQLCAEKNVGFICMKALCGGLITRADAAYAFLAQFPNVLPIWGIQKPQELEEFVRYMETPPKMTTEIAGYIAKEQGALAGDFCRGCGYCLPCPADIEINNAARMSLLLRRAPPAGFLTPEWQGKMQKIENCTGCGGCAAKCPYGLDTPSLLKKNYEDYKTFL